MFPLIHFGSTTQLNNQQKHLLYFLYFHLLQSSRYIILEQRQEQHHICFKFITGSRYFTSKICKLDYNRILCQEQPHQKQFQVYVVEAEDFKRGDIIEEKNIDTKRCFGSSKSTKKEKPLKMGKESEIERERRRGWESIWKRKTDLRVIDSQFQK